MKLETLKKLRNKNNLTQKDIAKILKKVHICRIGNRKKHYSSYKIIKIKQLF